MRTVWLWPWNTMDFAERGETVNKVSRFRLTLIAAEGIAANFLFGSLFVWSVLRNPLLELFPAWTEGMLSAIFGIHNLFVCLGILLAGRLHRRMSARRAMMLFGVMEVVGMGGFALLPVNMPIPAYVMAFILFCGFAATGTGIGINTVQSATIPWFPRHSGAISGALYMALGTSSVALAAVAESIMTKVSVLMVLPIFGAMIAAVVLLILADRGSLQQPESESAAAAESGLGPKEMLRSGTFIVLLVWNILLRTCGLTLLDHAASMAVFYGGATLVAMLIAPANGLGSIVVGATMDKLGIRRISLAGAVMMSAAALMLLGGTSTGSFVLIFAALMLGGFAYGGSSSSYAGAVKNSFGGKFYVQNFAISNIAMGIAAILEACSGLVLDIFGTYSAVAIMVIVMAVGAFAVSVFGKGKLPEKK